MTVELHSDRAGGRAIGQPHAYTVASPRDPATAVKAARGLLLSGAWRTVPKTGDAVDKAMYLLRVKVPAALTVLPRVAVAALTKELPQGGCSWCAVHLLAALSFGEEQEPARDELTLAFLGTPCAKCRSRHQIGDMVAAAVADARERLARGESLGPPPRRRALAAAEAAKRAGTRTDLGPSGAQSSDRGRAAKADALPVVAAAVRRGPDPWYYRRRRIDWPEQ